ncbi:ABC transporter permease [Caryophanon tenue]|uniref:Macrolide ABC transporter permease n=1 Tax=Caryophanon tenue TaxID=33978 RepID=A0A1C0Y670_9BACL|nr:FtsX-like permease family protein [Caryophanon tenue]OCS82625.1 macrolide ABC transporter permease [Caryophanon tenue]
MRFKDQLQFVTSHMRKNKLRVTMTILAATIGCAFLIVLASVGFGVQQTMEDEILQQETVTQIQLWGDEALTDADRTKIENMEHVNVIQTKSELVGPVEVAFEDRTTTTQSMLVDMEAQQQLPSNLAEGRLPEATNEIVVGYHFAQTLINDADAREIERKSREAEKNGTWYDGADEGYKGDILGKQVDITIPVTVNTNETKRFTVVGILEKPGYDWYIDNQVQFIDALQADLPMLDLSPSTTIFVDTLEYVIPTLDALKEQGYQVYSVVEELKEVEIFFFIFKAGLIFIGTIAVLISSIGIFNTMTMAVTERTREIGVLKAIGASPSLIQRLFLMESAFIGIIGTVLAIIISYTISIGVNAILPMILATSLGEGSDGLTNFTFSAIPLSLVLVASAISLGVAMISGWRPARKSTNIEVIQALRQEL